VLNIGKSGKSSGTQQHNTSKDKKTGGEGSTSEGTSPSRQQTQSTATAAPQPANESLLIEKMSLYLAKMALHDYDL